MSASVLGWSFLNLRPRIPTRDWTQTQVFWDQSHILLFPTCPYICSCFEFILSQPSIQVGYETGLYTTLASALGWHHLSQPWVPTQDSIAHFRIFQGQFHKFQAFQDIWQSCSCFR